MVDYVEVLKYPLLDIKSFLIGFLLGTLWFLLVPVIFIFGYMVETIRETIKKSNKLPHWFTINNWKKFLVHGFWVLLILIIYLLPALAVTTAAISFSGGPEELLMGRRINSMGIILSILSIILFLMGLFLLPMAIILYSASEDFRYSISLDEILPRIKRALIPYLRAYGFSLLVLIISFAILLIPFVNLLFGGILFYPLLFSARLFAEIFREYENL